MPRLRDIAERSGVSIRTVGRVLAGRGYVREEVRDRVQRTAQAMNYKPNRFAKSLSTQRSYEVTVLLLSSDELHMAQLAGFEHGLRGSEYRVNALCELNPPDVEPRYDQIIEELNKRDPDGVALIGAEHEAIEKLPQQIIATDIPYILLDGHGEELDCVRIDREQGVYDAVKYLQGKGHRKIAYLRPARSRKRLHPYHRARLDGYQRAMTETEASPRYLEVPDIEFQTVRELGPAIASDKERPDAILAYSDVVAMALLAGLHDAGVKIPQDLAVMGFDDRRPAALASPPLTTVAQPSYEVGLTAASILLKKMEGKEPPGEGWSRSLAMRIVARESA